MNKLLVVFALGVGSLAGCQKYVAIPNSASDRIWMITADQTEVFRCWDLKNQTGKLMAICRRAEHVGKTEETRFTELAERTNPPPHPDSTEVCTAPATGPTVVQAPGRNPG